jgi:hypothetical protein
LLGSRIPAIRQHFPSYLAFSRFVFSRRTPPARKNEMNNDEQNRQEKQGPGKNVADDKEETRCKPRQEKKNSDNDEHEVPFLMVGGALGNRCCFQIPPIQDFLPTTPLPSEPAQ